MKRARELRRDATDAEKSLWGKLGRHEIEGLQFRRQHTAIRDAARTAWLEGQGLRVFRFWNDEALKNIEGVLSVIANAATPPLPGPPPQGGRE